jgi:hypothetical protein
MNVTCRHVVSMNVKMDSVEYKTLRMKEHTEKICVKYIHIQKYCACAYI